MNLFNEQEMVFLERILSMGLRFLYTVDFNPIIERSSQTEPIREVKMIYLKEALHVAMVMITFIESHTGSYSDGDALMETWLKPRVEATAVTRTSSLYCVADYVLRNRYDLEPPYTEQQLSQVLKVMKLGRLKFPPYGTGKHDCLLAGQQFERLIGMEREKSLFFYRERVWFETNYNCTHDIWKMRMFLKAKYDEDREEEEVRQIRQYYLDPAFRESFHY